MVAGDDAAISLQQGQPVPVQVLVGDHVRAVAEAFQPPGQIAVTAENP